MSEPVWTRRQIRQGIGRLSRQEFFLRYPGGSVALTSAGASGENTTAVTTAPLLTQTADFWNGSYMWSVASSQEVRINDYSSDSGVLTHEYAISALSSADSIELYETWPPSQIHEAINQAIESAGLAYPNTVIDESLVIEENKMTYAMSGLSTAPYKILQVYMEQPASSITGNPTAVTATTLADAAQDFSTADTDHFVSVYAGTGSGQLREVSTGDSDGSLTVATWTTNPDTTSSYRYWDAGNQQLDWYRIMGARPEPNAYPDNIHLSALAPSMYGARLRLVMLAKPASLSADTDETTIPIRYITNKAMSILHDSLIGDNRVDRAVHASLAEYYDELAAKLLAQFPRRQPPGTIWTDESGNISPSRLDSVGDPLRWRG